MNAVLAAAEALDESATAKLATVLEDIRRLHDEMLAISKGVSLTSTSNPNVGRTFGTPRAATAASTSTRLRETKTKSSTAGRGNRFGGRRYV